MDEETPASSRKLFSCDQCGKKYQMLAHLRRHKQSHSKKAQHICQFCKRSFVKSYHLTLHLKSHSVEKPFECSECGKRFTYANHLTRHQRNGHKKQKHVEESGNKMEKTPPPAPIIKTYNCDHCSLKFRTKLGLMVHKSRHQIKKTGASTKCQYCNEECHSISNLKKHYNEIHSSEKRFKCECGKGFGRLSHLYEHRLIHSQIKPFICKDCGRGFIRKRSLRVHAKTHEGKKLNKTFFCQDCGTVVKVHCTTLSNVFSVTSLSDVKCFMKNHSLSPL